MIPNASHAPGTILHTTVVVDLIDGTQYGDPARHMYVWAAREDSDLLVTLGDRGTGLGRMGVDGSGDELPGGEARWITVEGDGAWRSGPLSGRIEGVAGTYRPRDPASNSIEIMAAEHLRREAYLLGWRESAEDRDPLHHVRRLGRMRHVAEQRLTEVTEHLRPAVATAVREGKPKTQVAAAAQITRTTLDNWIAG